MKRLVLDANVIISAVFGGMPLEAVCHASLHSVFINDTIEKELFGVVEKLSQKLSPHLLKEVKSQIDIIINNAKKVEVNQEIRICRDPKDNTYLEVAKASFAEILITGDKDLLSLTCNELKKAGLGGLRIISPREFVEEILR